MTSDKSEPHDALDKLRHWSNGKPINAEDDALCLAIGRAITTWSSLEGGIFICYLIASKPENVTAFTAAYHSIGSTRTQLNMCNSALTFYLMGNDELCSEWASIYNKATSYLKIRNNIAHYTMTTIIGKESSTVVLRPSMYKINSTVDVKDKSQPKMKERKGNQLPKLTVKDIQSNTQQFNALSTKISQFILKLNPSGSLKIAHNLDYI